MVGSGQNSNGQAFGVRFGDIPRTEVRTVARNPIATQSIGLNRRTGHVEQSRGKRGVESGFVE